MLDTDVLLLNKQIYLLANIIVPYFTAAFFLLPFIETI